MFNSLLNRLTRRRVTSQEGTRTVHINDRPQNSSYVSNRISNTKYTILTFLPKNLLEQFGRFMNIYFLFVACLQLSPILAPVNPATTWVPLTLIFAISAFKEAVDDFYRYKGDRAANTKKYWILSPEAGGKVQISAENIRVGDLVYLRENDEVPCDLVILKTADVDTYCAYIQTANLDGETDLKTRSAVRATATMSEEELLHLRGTIECAHPNAEIYKFDSRLKITSNSTPPGTHAHDSSHSPLAANTIQAGRSLRVSHDPNRHGHRRAASSGRALPPGDDSQAPLAPQHPVLPRRTRSSQLVTGMQGHRRALSLGGTAALAEADNPSVDETSPYYIPAHKGGHSRADSIDENGTWSIPLDPSHTAWQATTIRNVAWVVGVVVYTGNETKVGMNKSIPPSKWTKIDMIVNRATIAVFVLQVVLTLLLGATGDFWLVYNADRHWYLQEKKHTKWYNWLVIPLRFLLLMSLMIPISLKVTLDAVKYIYALLIDWDLDMVDPETGTAANCHSSALAEDLGQIDYIFSDKTGTLTENVMVFAQCSINNVIYDGQGASQASHLDDEASFAELESADESDMGSVNDPFHNRESKKKDSKKQHTKKKARPTAATDKRLKALLAERDPLAYDFCRILALCNTAMPTIDDENCLVWKCASPDEEALVVAAAELGFTLKSSRSDELVLEIDPTGPSYTERTTLARKRHAAMFEDEDSSAASAATKSKKSNSSTTGKDHSKSTSAAKSHTTSPKKKKVVPINVDEDSHEVADDTPEVTDEDATTNQTSMTNKLKKLMRIGGSKTGTLDKRSESPSDRVDEEVGENGEEGGSNEAAAAERRKKKKKKRVRIATTENETEVVHTREDPEDEDEDDDSPKTTEKYTVLHILEFTSDRKRMSVMLRSQRTGELVLLMKGADDKVLAALAPHQHKKDIIADVEHFAQLGLRTLCLCQRVVSESEYTKWSIRLNKAATAMKDREALVAEAYAEIEQDFQFVGITAIEDKLQQGVPETIELLRRAGIKIWMLTGDKLATAVQIATSCNLIKPTSVLAGEVFTIEGKTFDSALASLNATIAKVLPLTRGMGATNTSSSTGVRLNSYFDQPKAYNYQHLALKTAAQTNDDDIIVGIDPEDGKAADDSDSSSSVHFISHSAITPRSKRGSKLSEDTLRDLKSALAEGGTDRRLSMSDGLTGAPISTHPTSPRDTTSDFDDASSMASQADMIRMKTRRRYYQTDDDSGLESNDGSVHVTDDEHEVEFQAQQYYQQYHDQQFHVPAINPNTKLLPHRTVGGVATGAGGKRELSLVVEGSTLTHLLRPACKARFLQLALEAHTVICCRVTPQQKAQVVELVKCGVSGVAGGKQERTTLAIGDGGNDVSMIQAASVGIGLKGREGLQAARASDFSLAKFRFLAKLILVHGRWSYRRTAFVAHYCFHKSLFLAFMQIFYAFFTGFAGTSLFDSFALASYNVLFTGVPIMFYSLDKDINEQNLLLNPQLYHETQSGRFINTFTILYWFVRSFAQSALVFFCVIMLGHDRTRNGFPSDWISTSSMAYGACVIVQCLTIFLESNQLTVIHHVVIWGTLALYFLAMMVIDVIIPVFNGVVFGLFSDPVFWFGLVLAVAAAILPIVALRFIMITWFPTRSQLVQRMESLSSKEYESFAKSEKRRREARASYIQESHEVASLVKKKPPTTNFLMGTIYRFQSATGAGRKRETDQTSEKPQAGRGSKHPSTLRRTTPATPEVLSEDENPRSRTSSFASYDGADSGFDSDHITMGRLMDDGKPKMSPPLKPEIVDPQTFMAAAAVGSTKLFASAENKSGSPERQGASPPASPPGSGKIRHNKKAASVDRSSQVTSQETSPGSASLFGYGPKPPRRPRGHSTDRTMAHQSTGAITASTGGDDLPPSHLSAGEVSANRLGLSNPVLSASESNIAALLGDATGASGTRRPPNIGSAPARGSVTAFSPKRGSAPRKNTGTSPGAVGGTKISPIPSLSQRPAYSIEAGHAGTLQVVPLHLIGKKGSLVSSQSSIPGPNDDEAEGVSVSAQSASFSQLPAFIPGDEKPGSSGKRARSRSHNPHGGTSSSTSGIVISSPSSGNVGLHSSSSSVTANNLTSSSIVSPSSPSSPPPTRSSPPTISTPSSAIENRSHTTTPDLSSEVTNKSEPLPVPKQPHTLNASQSSNDSETLSVPSNPGSPQLSVSPTKKSKIKVSSGSVPNDQ